MSTAYERYVDWKKLGFAIAAFLVVLFIPLPASMLDVGVEYTAGKTRVQQHFTQELFSRDFADAEQWQAMTARILEANMIQGAMARKMAEEREKDTRWLKQNSIASQTPHLAKYGAAVRAVPEDRFKAMMEAARKLKLDDLKFDALTDSEKGRAREDLRGTDQDRPGAPRLRHHLLPDRGDADADRGVCHRSCAGPVWRRLADGRAAFYWTDSVWFIMGSLMFAATIVKTGVDRIGLSRLRRL